VPEVLYHYAEFGRLNFARSRGGGQYVGTFLSITLLSRDFAIKTLERRNDFYITGSEKDCSYASVFSFVPTRRKAAQRGIPILKMA